MPQPNDLSRSLVALDQLFGERGAPVAAGYASKRIGGGAFDNAHPMLC